MSECLVDVVEADPSRRVVSFDRLQAGDVSQEGRLGETDEDEDSVAAFETPQRQGLSLGKRFTHLGRLPLEAVVSTNIGW